jgi:hypothetical protein
VIRLDELKEAHRWEAEAGTPVDRCNATSGLPAAGVLELDSGSVVEAHRDMSASTAGDDFSSVVDFAGRLGMDFMTGAGALLREFSDNHP